MDRKLNWRQKVAVSLAADMFASPQTRSPIKSGGGYMRSSGISRDTPTKNEYNTFRELYRFNPIVRSGINLRAHLTVQPGYSIYADDDATKEYLEEWAEECAIHAGEENQPLQPLLWEIARDIDVDGMVLLEHVYDNPEQATDFMQIQKFDPKTVDLECYIGTSRLLRPDEPNAPKDAYENSRGEVAAYVQEITSNGTTTKVPLSQNDVTKLGRDWAGARGTSLVEAIVEDAQTLRAQKQDYKNSIAAVAYPRLLVEFEDYDLPNGTIVEWDETAITDYMDGLRRTDSQKSYTKGSWENPGTFLGSPPGVEVTPVQGQVPDIQHSLNHLIEHIILGLELPKFMLGFAEGINRDIVEQQLEVFHGMIESRRREIDVKLTQLFKYKAELGAQAGEIPNAEGVRFAIEPNEDDHPLKPDEYALADLKLFMESMDIYTKGGSDIYFPPELVWDLMNIDQEKYDLDSILKEQEDFGENDVDQMPFGPNEQNPPDNPNEETNEPPPNQEGE